MVYIISLLPMEIPYITIMEAEKGTTEEKLKKYIL